MSDPLQEEQKDNKFIQYYKNISQSKKKNEQINEKQDIDQQIQDSGELDSIQSKLQFFLQQNLDQTPNIDQTKEEDLNKIQNQIKNETLRQKIERISKQKEELMQNKNDLVEQFSDILTSDQMKETFGATKQQQANKIYQYLEKKQFPQLEDKIQKTKEQGKKLKEKAQEIQQKYLTYSFIAIYMSMSAFMFFSGYRLFKKYNAGTNIWKFLKEDIPEQQESYQKINGKYRDIFQDKNRKKRK
ncbi:hypothetical protein PPERSA_12434 [Pseudocohnilembus persalinus]|uniref:Transmembrane protein n=1 Tax=Pseudocohnilembus persalinus TaxID=266149 RepID=A0A0V0QNQ2_PSEPJ|nr:hypothetical protein PPERSA_12434 [Pseudocohnilembus persalinus]|eukprot:KRX03987.1 hypothetical protein PPERSA_12434 [Pseudocohnilembus persalinus]